MEQEKIVRSPERERVVETKEDVELSEEIKAAAARERVEYLTKEVSKGTQQIQNIMLNMQQALQALAAVRASLQLESVSDDPSSIVEDKRRVAELRKKITKYQEELLVMKQKMGNVLGSEHGNDVFDDSDVRTRAHTLMTEVEKILDEISFTATDRAGEKIIINKECSFT